jgi:hypothetical protein
MNYLQLKNADNQIIPQYNSVESSFICLEMFCIIVALFQQLAQTLKEYGKKQLITNMAIKSYWSAVIFS